MERLDWQGYVCFDYKCWAFRQGLVGAVVGYRHIHTRRCNIGCK